MTGYQPYLRQVRAVSWTVALAVGFLNAWATRFSLTADATAYFDIATAYLRRDWALALNAYWSPLFSWLLAVVFALFHPSPFWESTALSLLNFVAFLVSLACFEYFFRGLLEAQEKRNSAPDKAAQVPALYWWMLGYALFFSTSLFVLDLSSSTPDIWLSAFTYLVCGLLSRIWAGGGSPALFGGLGLALGLAYLTKTFYFPMSFVFLLTGWLTGRSSRKAVASAGLSVVLFALVAGPWVATLSRVKGRFTYGDVGKIAFAMTVDRIPQALFWRGENNTGTPKHAVRQLFDQPHIFEYSSPARGTYPPGSDRSYWMEGVAPYFSLKGELAVLRQSVGTFYQFFMAQAEFAVGLLVLFFLIPKRRLWKLLWSLKFLWVPAGIACLSYSTVLVEGRYVASFLLVLWIAAFFCLLAASSDLSPKLVAALVLSMTVVCALRVAKLAEMDSLTIATKPVNSDWEIAQDLYRLGVRPGDRISCLGSTDEVDWARLAGITIVSGVPAGEDAAFWAGDDEKQQHLLRLLASTGARFVITKTTFSGVEKQGWVRLGNTSDFARPLPVAPEVP